DINGDGVVSPIDALVVINDLNENGARELPLPGDAEGPPPYLDSSGDGWVTSVDALRVINLLNAQASAEGEGLVIPPVSSADSSLDPSSGLIKIEESALADFDSQHDYSHHCQVADLVLELWFSGVEDVIPSDSLEELEFQQV
ncbi:MAG: dockerin type I domain-containing protein, partial [Planctomycetota bacterium]|nr:dockerin type I domain-containing protein [Planctomycetota bacterium]